MEKRRKGTLRDWLIVLVLLLDDAAALVLVLLVLWFFRVAIPLWAMVVIGVLLGTFVFILHRAVIPSLHRKKVTGSEGMLGLKGEVVEPLTPVGVIRVEGEYWKARSVDGNIAVGEDVEVVELKGLTLKVKRKSQ